MRSLRFRDWMGWLAAGVAVFALLPLLMELAFPTATYPLGNFLDDWAAIGILSVMAMFMVCLYSIFFSILAKDRRFLRVSSIWTVVMIGVYSLGYWLLSTMEWLRFHSGEG